MTIHTLFAPGGATEVKQDDIIAALALLLTELAQKLEPGQEVALNAATVAALENIGVTNWPTDFPLPAGQVTTLTPQTDALTDAELRASDVDVADSGERPYTHKVATVTASGDTTIHTPAAGKRIRLRWVYAINDPSSSSPPLIKVKLGSTEIYRVWALSKRQLVDGAIDAPLVINLTGTGTVAVTALLEEI